MDTTMQHENLPQVDAESGSCEGYPSYVLSGERGWVIAATVCVGIPCAVGVAALYVSLFLMLLDDGEFSYVVLGFFAVAACKIVELVLWLGKCRSKSALLTSSIALAIVAVLATHFFYIRFSAGPDVSYAHIFANPVRLWLEFVFVPPLPGAVRIAVLALAFLVESLVIAAGFVVGATILPGDYYFCESCCKWLKKIQSMPLRVTDEIANELICNVPINSILDLPEAADNEYLAFTPMSTNARLARSSMPSNSLISPKEKKKALRLSPK